MRLFVAIRLDQKMRAALADMQRQMRDQHVSGNYTPDENMHLTLAFIGDYPNQPFRLRLLR